MPSRQQLMVGGCAVLIPLLGHARARRGKEGSMPQQVTSGQGLRSPQSLTGLVSADRCATEPPARAQGARAGS
jgi:hypothetical protein